MPVSIEKSAKTVQLAIEEALTELQLTDDDVIVEVLEEAESGLLGLGRKNARVRVTAAREDLTPAPLETEQEMEALISAEAEDDAYEVEADDSLTSEEAETVSYLAAVLSGIGIHGKISSYREDDTIFVDVSGRDCGAAIGRRGETLNAIQYLASLVANKVSEKRIRVVLDIAGYRKRREDSLVGLAERTAKKVRQTGRPFNLEPMNPAERRIVHSALQGFAGITTYSVGSDAQRHVVVAPSDE